MSGKLCFFTILFTVLVACQAKELIRTARQLDRHDLSEESEERAASTDANGGVSVEMPQMSITLEQLQEQLKVMKAKLESKDAKINDMKAQMASLQSKPPLQASEGSDSKVEAMTEDDGDQVKAMAGLSQAGYGSPAGWVHPAVRNTQFKYGEGLPYNQGHSVGNIRYNSYYAGCIMVCALTPVCKTVVLNMGNGWCHMKGKYVTSRDGWHHHSGFVTWFKTGPW